MRLMPFDWIHNSIIVYVILKINKNQNFVKSKNWSDNVRKVRICVRVRFRPFISTGHSLRPWDWVVTERNDSSEINTKKNEKQITIIWSVAMLSPGSLALQRHRGVPLQTGLNKSVSESPRGAERRLSCLNAVILPEQVDLMGLVKIRLLYEVSILLLQH